MPRAGKTIRVEFTTDHDKYLVQYLAKYCPSREGRSGNKIFQDLVANKNNRWPWSVHHTWQSWRERYVKNTVTFDRRILNHQRKHEVPSVDTRKRAGDPMPIETLGPSAKRVKLEKEEEEESSSSEIPAATQHEDASLSRSKSTAQSLPQYVREPPETPSQAPNSGKHTRTPRTAPASPSRTNNHASASATKQPTALQMRDDTLEILSSPNRQAPFPAEPRSPPRHVKHIKVRCGTPSDMFASEPSSPRNDAVAPVNVEGPSSQPQPAPVSSSAPPRAPPRVVESFHGQVLVDREGHIPRALLHGEKHGAEEEEDKAQWPPVRGRTVKQMHTSGQDVKADVHHAFSQPQPWPEALPEGLETDKRDQAKPPLDRRTVADRFSGPTRRFPQVEGGQREDVVRDGASPVKRVVTTTPPDPFSGRVPKPSSKAFKFPAPRASTRSPFRPEPLVEETRRQPELRPQPQRRPPLRAKARHPELTRIRRQSIGNGNGRQRQRNHRREVPSVDLVALSHSSISARSHSRSSAGTSVPTRPPRWSLPAFAHATPWLFNEPPSMYGDPWRGRARTTSLVTSTPSPALSIAGATTSHANGIPAHASPSVSLTPHPPDVPLTASHGLASILAHMSANHRLALGVVEAVYKRVGSLREADEVLKGMREAAEVFGEWEIERRVRERRAGRAVKNGDGPAQRGDDRGSTRANGRTDLSYVVASEGGEGSEYSPPETSRAAMWKRQSESSCIEEGEGERAEEDGEEADDEEAEEGREVEEELRDLDEYEDDGEDGTRHDVALAGENDKDEDDGAQEDSREEQRVTEALLEDTRLAQELERKLGKGRYRMHVARLFV